MKKLIFFINCFILLIQSSLTIAQTTNVQVKNDLNEEHLNGKVKTLTEISYRAIDTSGMLQKGDTVYNCITQFDDKGNIIEKNIFKSIPNTDSFGLEYKNTYRYDSSGNEIEENIHSPDDPADVKWIKKNVIYDRGNIVKFTLYLNSEPFHIVVRKFEYY